jgi:hypothetical protein
MLLAQATACALLRAWDSAGSRMLMRIAMMPITTSSSTRVKARARPREMGDAVMCDAPTGK